MNKLLLALALLFAPGLAHAQCNGIFSPNTICGTIAGGPPGPVATSVLTGVPAGTSGQIQYNSGAGTFAAFTVGGDCTVVPSTGVFTCLKVNGVTLTSLATNSGVGIEDNTRTTSPTSAPTISSSNCGAPVALGGNALYTTTVGAASGFTAGCELIFINTDAWPTGSTCSAITGGRGKVLSVNGLTVPLLWPQQTYKFRNIANVWYQDPAYQRVIVPTGQKFCFDAVSGSDASDGFGTGANAWKTLNHGWQTAWQSWQSAGGSSSGGNADFDFRLLDDSSCVVTTGANCHQGIHFAGAFPGVEGHNATMIECDSGSATNCTIADTSNSAVGTFNAGINLELQNVTLTAKASNNAIIAAERGMIRIEGGVVLGAAGTNSPQLFAQTSSGYIILEGGTTTSVSGGGGFFAESSNGGVIQMDQVTVTFVTSVAYTQQTLSVNAHGLITANTVGWVTSGVTVTAPANIGCSTLGMLVTSGASASIPGTATPLGTCTSSNQGNYN